MKDQRYLQASELMDQDSRWICFEFHDVWLQVEPLYLEVPCGPKTKTGIHLKKHRLCNNIINPTFKLQQLNHIRHHYALNIL